MSNESGVQNQLGLNLMAEGKAAEALPHFSRAIRIDPKNAGLYANLANALGELGRQEDAVAALRQGIRADPTLPILHNNFSILLEKLGRVDEAVDAGAEAVRLDPASAYYHQTYARGLESSGDLDAADREFQETLRLDPQSDRAADSRCFIANFNPSCDAAAVLAVAKDWSRRFEHSEFEPIPHTNSRDPHRRLKIGYVSSMFYDQAESFFVLPLLESHNHDQFEIHCFSNGRPRDAVTERHHRAVDHWHNIRNVEDRHAASLIRQQGIDILIDLTMHMADNRLRLFTLRPAPVQMTWLAYPGTTGLKSIDYRITDPIIDPPGSSEPYSEKSLRLKTSWCCYDPLGDMPTRRSTPTQFIRFGSFNNPFKINEPLLRLWGRTMLLSPASRIAMLSQSARQREKIRGVLGKMGISKDRIGFSPPLSRERYLRLYNEIDIALDTLPYNGITTTCDALLMGVPVVTMKGARASGRAGASLLAAAGLRELVADSEGEFVEIAAVLAQQTDRLHQYHAELPERVRGSALTDRGRFTTEMETAYRTAWESWCGK